MEKKKKQKNEKTEIKTTCKINKLILLQTLFLFFVLPHSSDSDFLYLQLHHNRSDFLNIPLRYKIFDLNPKYKITTDYLNIPLRSKLTFHYNLNRITDNPIYKS